MHTNDEIIHAIRGVAIAVHRDLGPGLLESVYEDIFSILLIEQGFQVQRQLLVPIKYKGLTIERGFRLDLLVNQKVIVEIKSTERPQPIFAQQLLTYLRGLGLRDGLLINMGFETAIAGMTHIVNYRGEPSGVVVLGVNAEPVE